jgi:hypothetical protein
VNTGLILQRARGAPRRCAHTVGTREAICARSQARPPFALSETQHTERTTAHDLGGSPQAARRSETGRGRARGAAPPDERSRGRRPDQGEQRNATHDDASCRVDARESRVGQGGSNRRVPSRKRGGCIRRYTLDFLCGCGRVQAAKLAPCMPGREVAGAASLPYAAGGDERGTLRCRKPKSLPGP